MSKKAIVLSITVRIVLVYIRTANGLKPKIASLAFFWIYLPKHKLSSLSKKSALIVTRKGDPFLLPKPKYDSEKGETTVCQNDRLKL